MPRGDGRWAELSSQNERVFKSDDQVRPEWSALASSRERLLDAADPLFPADSGSHRITSLRLVASAA